MKKQFLMAVLAMALFSSHVTVGMEGGECKECALTQQQIYDVNDLDKQLIEATKKGDLPSVKELIKNGADVNAKNINDITPLHAAASCGHKDVVIELIDAGADVNAKNKNDITPLMFATYRGSKDAVIALIDAGADVNTQDNAGRSPLSCAVHQVNSLSLCVDRVALLDTVVALIEGGAGLNSDILHWAAREGYKNVVIASLKKGVNVNTQTPDGATPLNQAAYFGHKDIVVALIKSGANVNVKNINEITPLHFATYRGNKDIVVELARRGADLYIKDEDGNTTLDLIKDKEFKKQIIDARSEFEKKQRELRERLITTAASLQYHKFTRDEIGEVLEKSAVIWGVKKMAKVSGKDEDK